MSPKCQQTNNLLNLVVTQVPWNWQLAILFEPTCQETVYLLKLVVIENARYWQLIETSCAMKKITFNSLTHKNDVIFWSLLQHISEHCWRKIFFALQKQPKCSQQTAIQVAKLVPRNDTNDKQPYIHSCCRVFWLFPKLKKDLNSQPSPLVPKLKLLCTTKSILNQKLSR